MRYLAELAWAPDAILHNQNLRWRVDDGDNLAVSVGAGADACEVVLSLNDQGRISSAFAPNRPRSTVPPYLPTPWRGYFSDYRLHKGRWLPFAAAVSWEVDGPPFLYWQGSIEEWELT